jgi:cell division protease FtsH
MSRLRRWMLLLLGERRNYSEEMAALIHEEVRRMVDEVRVVAHKMITERRATLNRLAERLISEKTVKSEELDGMLQQTRPQLAAARG